MVKVFSKLNDKSQKGIKELKLIYKNLSHKMMALWEQISTKVLNGQILSAIN